MMADLKKVLNALKNCTAQQKCRNCNWSECESEHKSVEIPLTLAKDAMKLLKEQKKRIEELESEKRWECYECPLKEVPDNQKEW